VSEPLLATLLAAEHAAVYGYGVLGARLDEVSRATARAAVVSHRSRRDQLVALLRSLGVVPGPALPAYDVDARTPAQALALATRLEDGLSVRWRDLVVGTDDRGLRELGVAGLQETAVRAAQWRLLAGDLQVTLALPGVA